MEWTSLLTGIKAASSLYDASEKSDNALKNAKSAAKAYQEEGTLAMNESARQTRYAAARQTVSFLQSGLTLEGTPTDVINETYATGAADVNQIAKNTNAAIHNALSSGKSQSKAALVAGRTAAIESIGQKQVMLAAGNPTASAPSGLFDDITGFFGNKFNNNYFGNIGSSSNLGRYLDDTSEL